MRLANCNAHHKRPFAVVLLGSSFLLRVVLRNSRKLRKQLQAVCRASFQQDKTLSLSRSEHLNTPHNNTRGVELIRGSWQDVPQSGELARCWELSSQASTSTWLMPAVPRLVQMQYDTDVTTWSPQGRLFQVEYAMEAVKQGSCSVGLVVSMCVRPGYGSCRARGQRALRALQCKGQHMCMVMLLCNQAALPPAGVVGLSRRQHARAASNLHARWSVP